MRSLSQKNLFGKFERTHLPPTYRRFYAKFHQSRPSPEDRNTLSRRIDLLGKLRPNIPRYVDKQPDFILYTDASLLSRKVSDLAIRRSPNVPVLQLLATAVTPHSWMKKFSAKNPIVGLEMMAPVSPLWTSPDLCLGWGLNLYVDKDKASNTPIRGSPGHMLIRDDARLSERGR